MQQPQDVAKAILQNIVTSTNQQLVCTMAMVCRDWRVATQAGPAGLLHVTLDLGNSWAGATDGLPPKSMQKLAGFSKWLPKHAGMVSGITVSGTPPKDTALFESNAEATFILALRSAATATAATGAALRPLCLQSYSSNIFHSNAVIQALPTGSLKQLTIRDADLNLTAAAAALPLLTNLQSLATKGCYSGYHPLAVVAIGQLSSLTSLEGCHISSCHAELLPVQLLALDLSIVNNSDGSVNLLHLTRLTGLKFRSQYGGTKACRLPTQILQLAVTEFGMTTASIYSRFAISSLTQLTALTIYHSIETSEELLQLGALPALQELSLCYTQEDAALAAAPAWTQLHQLHSIKISGTRSSPSTWANVCSRLSSLTRLTQLCLQIYLKSEQQQAPHLAICGNLTTLRMLQDLELALVDLSARGHVAWEQGDINQLSCLTGLTRLDLYIRDISKETFTDATVVELLRGLKGLQELAVRVKSETVLPVIADLKNLEKLEGYHMPAKAQQSGLQYLRGMKGLTRLWGFWDCSKEALADFWAAV